MKRHSITAALTLLAVVTIAFRVTHRKQHPIPHGFRTVLFHDCSNEEALREFGDDRQIIVTSHADGALSINETPLTSSAIGPELAKIFEYRSLKLVWYIANPHLTYGQAIKDLSALHQDTTNFVVAMPTTIQIVSSNAATSQCPYGF
jgi:hypothetical protein